MMFHRDIHNITHIIKKYIDIYNDEDKMPFIKNVVNQLESDDYLEKDIDNKYHPLHECYRYYQKIYDIEDNHKNKCKKNNQVDNIFDLINDMNQYMNQMTVQEYCCGKSKIMNKIVENYDSEYYGYG